MGLRKLAKRVLGVQRQPTYYLPWLTRPHLQCALVLSNVQLPLPPAPGGCGFVTVKGERINSDLYVTLSDGLAYTATHGRGEFIERYALPGWMVLAAVGALLALAGRAIPAFVRHQYAYVGPDSRSHLLVMNLSNVTNRVRVVASRNGRVLGARLLRLPPMGSTLLDVGTLGAAAAGAATEVWRIRLEGAAWFNLYVVGTGARNLEGPLSLMHVK